MKITKSPIYVIALIFINVNCWSKDYNILDYGAIGDGLTMNTEAIQSSIDSCSNSGVEELLSYQGNI